jgi:hypothetical protein
MSISNNYAPVKQLGNGVTVAFSGSWKLLNKTYLRVYLESVATGVQTLQVEGTNYSVTFNDAGFIVTMNVAPTAANYIVIGREVDLTQTDPYRTSKGFQGQKIEDSFDKLTAIEQDQDDQIQRSLKFKLGSSVANFIIDEPIDGRSLKWDVTNERIVNSSSDIDEVIAQVDADAAQVAADKAAAEAANVSAEGWANIAQSSATVGTYTKARMRTTANIALTGLQTINGIVGVAGDRVLVMNQTTTSQNGLYDMAAGAWTRCADADTWNELVSKIVVIEESGTTFAESAFICSSNRGGTIGVTAVTFIDFVAPLADGAVSTAAKVVDGVLTYVKLAAAAFATTVDDIVNGTAGKIINAATFKLFRTTPPILRVQCTKASGTNGGQRAATGSWQDSNAAAEVLLNTVVTNNITGASVASGVITLPAGTYKIRGFKTFYNTAASRVRFFNITDGAGLVVGSSTYASGSAGTGDSRFDDTFFTIAGIKTIKMQTWVSGSSGAAFDLGVAVATGDTEIYGDFTFEKVA